MFPEHQLYALDFTEEAMPQADISLPTETTRKQGMERLRQPGQSCKGKTHTEACLRGLVHVEAFTH